MQVNISRKLYKCCIVASCRGVKIFSGLLAFDNYVPSQNYGGLRANEWASEKESERVARWFSARWAPLCSEVKRTVQARLSSSSIPRLYFAAVYSSPAEDDSAVLQSSFSDSHRGFLFPPSALFYSPSSRGFILQYLLRLIIKFLLSANIIRSSFVPSQIFLLTAVLILLVLPSSHAFTVIHPSIALAFASM